MSPILDGLLYLLQPLPFLYCFIGTLLGIVVGAIPGLTGAMLIALTLPLTFHMSDTLSMVLMVAMYVGSISGGLITATLLRMPGTPSNIMTTFDGFPMARAGEPGRALGLGITASFIGGLISWIFLVVLARPMSEWAVLLGPFDYFGLVLTALVLIVTISQASMMKGLLSGFLGVLVALPGVDPSTGFVRLTFGFHALEGGFGLLPVLVGIFAFNQILADILGIRAKVPEMVGNTKGIVIGLREIRRHWQNLLQSSLIGTWIGILPGIGANVGSVVSYSVAKTTSKNRDQFGKGAPEGIIASETANNATIGGALIPLIAMGIPGSVIDAILIGALILHGIQPGPLLFVNNAPVVYSIIGAAFVANVMMYLMMVVSARQIARVVMIPKAYLLPVIAVFCVVGTYAVANRPLDVWIMMGFGLLGFLLERTGVPLQPFVIGFVLAPIGEEYLRSGLMMSAGSLVPLVTRPVAAICVVVSLALLLLPLFFKRKRLAVP